MIDLNIESELRDLRKIAAIILLPLIVSFIAIFAYSKEIIKVLLSINDIDILDLIVLTPIEIINIQINISFILSAVLCMPVIIWCVVWFLEPVIKRESIWTIILYIYCSTLLAYIGFIFGTTLFSKFLIKAFLYQQFTGVMWSVSSVLSLILQIGLAFSIIFQLIVLIPMFIDLGVVTRGTLIKFSWPIFLGIVILSSLITPPDVFSQIIIAGPTVIAFYTGILVSKLTGGKK